MLANKLKVHVGSASVKDPITEKIIAACFSVHSELGPGFSEKVYHNAIKYEFEKRDIRYETEKEFKVNYQAKIVGTLRIDLVVENKVIVEVKAVSMIPEVFKQQIIAYLKASKMSVGLIVNFGAKSCEIKRFLN